MKKLIALLFVICIFTACKKAKQDQNSLTGNWTWFRTNLGFSGSVETPQSSGKNWHLLLQSNSTYTQTGDYYGSNTGSYALTVNNNNKHITFTPSNATAFEFNYTLVSSDTLRFDDNVETDGPSYFFVRD